MPKFPKRVESGAGGLWDGPNRAYSDSNPPETLMMTEFSSAVATPSAGKIVMYSPDGTALLWKDDTGTVRTLGGGTKGSDLPSATALAGADKVFIIQGGATKTIPASLVVPVPWVEVPMIIGQNTALTPAAASATVGTELHATAKSCRNKLDLSWATEARLVGMVIATGNATGAAFKLSYATAEASTWSSGTGVADAGPSLIVGSIGGGAGVQHDTGWVSLAAGARIDNCFVTLLVGTALGSTAATVGAVSLFVR